MQGPALSKKDHDFLEISSHDGRYRVYLNKASIIPEWKWERSGREFGGKKPPKSKDKVYILKEILR